MFIIATLNRVFWGVIFHLLFITVTSVHKIFKRLLGMEFAQNCQSSI